MSCSWPPGPLQLAYCAFSQSERVHIDTANAMDAKGSASNPPAYESVSRGQASQVIIKDKDGKALGPVYDYFLIASRWVDDLAF